MISIILFVCFICSLILFVIVMYNTEYEDTPMEYEHTDHDKTKEICIIIDDDEYRFVFEAKNK